MELLTDMWQLFQVRQGDVWDALQEHFFLVFVSMSFAVLIAVPLGVLLTSLKRLSEPIIGIAAVAQTIPSLALLGFMLPVLGIGTNNAIFALTVYALLPILRNTYTGILEVDKATVDAGRGLGMTRGQILTKIQLPLALPVIMAGIRTSTVIVIGVATLATFVGAGGLGDIIMRGLAMQNSALTLLGAIPAAILAIIADFILKRIEILATPKGLKKNKRGNEKSSYQLHVQHLYFLLVGAVASDEDTVVVGGKDFTEQIILTHMVAELLEANTDLTIEREDNLGNTEILTQGWTVTSTCMLSIQVRLILLFIMKSTRKTLHLLRKSMIRLRLSMMKSTALRGMNLTLKIGTRSCVLADAADVADMSDLESIAGELTLAHNANFGERTDGLMPMNERYGYDWGTTTQMDEGLMYDALRNEEVDVIAAFTTDGRIPAYDLEVIADDLNFFPPYYAAPIVMNDTIEAHPEIEELLLELGPLLTEETMAELNAEVDINAELEEVVARNFLVEQGLIEE
ncbi:LOW QUALITY PROTEIN: osmotically activated L-carnitine/choline ABC transporter, permease protein OpuCB [Geomicrobium sp. JCM 19038]|nr:LOW QUALITY PROTEIN: osmotically activated L-carnitine/choline ABC transporter, permease protein OpuCB [Geomicrobium sp. JCM 19038]